jgi:hypothetical protein
MSETTHVWLRADEKFDTSLERSLDFKRNKVEFLTFEQLSETIDERKSGSVPVNGILHKDLFRSIDERFKESSLSYELKPIAAVEGGPGSMPGVVTIDELTENYGQGSLKSHLLRRLIGLFLITQSATDKYSHGLVVSFHQDGIQAAYGPNINACANMAILNAEMQMQTYGGKRVTVPKMLEVIGEWLTKFEEHRERDIKILEKMHDIQLTYRDVAELVGHLTFLRKGRDSNRIKANPEYPLNQGQIGEFSENYLIRYQALKRETESPELSLYEIYNLATNMHQPGMTDLPKIIPANHALGQLLIEKYELAAG